MYKNKDKQRQANREAVQRFRAKNKENALSAQKNVSKNAPGLRRMDKVCNTRPVIPPDVIPDVVLPDDPILACNKHVSWSDVLKLDRQAIDIVYSVSKAMKDDVLLRLRRAAGYHLRTGR